MLVDLMGMGKRPEEIIGRLADVPSGLRAVRAGARRRPPTCSGLRIDEIRRSIETATLPHDVEVALRHAARRHGRRSRSCRGPRTRDDGPVLVAEEYWTVTDIPGWDLALEGVFLVRVSSTARPASTRPRIGNDRSKAFAGVAGGQLAVAMTAVRAIPYVAGARPASSCPRVRRLPMARRLTWSACGGDEKDSSEVTFTVNPLPSFPGGLSRPGGRCVSLRVPISYTRRST